jgi:hypothetical protein
MPVKFYSVDWPLSRYGRRKPLPPPATWRARCE